MNHARYPVALALLLLAAPLPVHAVTSIPAVEPGLGDPWRSALPADVKAFLGPGPDAMPTGPVPAPSTAVRAVLPIDTGDPAAQRALAQLDALPQDSATVLAHLLGHYGEVVTAHEAGDTTGLRAAQADLAHAALRLAAVHGSGPSAATGPIVLAPLLAFDLDGTASLYEQDVLLLVDLGGDDVYHNNAGGSGLADTGLPGTDGDPCTVVTPELEPGVRAAAVLLDLGGDDVYGDVGAPRSCGANGGGSVAGAGFLFDAQGDDQYVAGDRGVNGGASAWSSGALVDLGGNDVYSGGDTGVNGGGGERGGHGMLVDAAGNDRYVGGDHGVNGGGRGGSGALFDLAGNDVYTAGQYGVNGGGAGRSLACLVVHCTVPGQGLLLDAAGSDEYRAAGRGANGGGYLGGHGTLVDGDGHDRYAVDNPAAASGIGANGGAYGADSFGALTDHGQGDDVYTAGSYGVNGGAALGGVASLVDHGGDDVYVAGGHGSNGGVVGAGVGLLLDLGGRDTYSDENAPSGSGMDKTLAPKGTLGAQVDIG